MKIDLIYMINLFNFVLVLFYKYRFWLYIKSKWLVYMFDFIVLVFKSFYGFWLFFCFNYVYIINII